MVSSCLQMLPVPSHSVEGARAAAIRGRALSLRVTVAEQPSAGCLLLEDLHEDLLCLLAHELALASAVSLSSCSRKLRALLPASMLLAWQKSLRQLVRSVRALCVQTHSSVDELLLGKQTSLDVEGRCTQPGCFRALMILCASGELGQQVEQLRLGHNEAADVAAQLQALASWSGEPRGGRLETLAMARHLLPDIAGSGAGALAGSTSCVLPRLLKLSLAGNHVGDEGVCVLADMLLAGGLCSLESLDLSANALGDEGMRTLSTVVARGLLCRCESLLLSNNLVGNSGLLSLCAALRHCPLERLLHLHLNSNGIGDDGIVAFARAVCARRRPLPRIQNIGLAFNPMSDVGHEALAQSVSSGSLANLRRVALRSTSIASRKAELAINLRLQHSATQQVGFLPQPKPACRRASEVLEDACSRLSGHSARITQRGILAERLSALRESEAWRAVVGTAAPDTPL